IELFPASRNSYHTMRGDWIQTHKKFVYSLSAFFLILLGMLFFHLPSETLKVYFALFFMVLFYEGGSYLKFSFRSVPYLKSFYIALVWSLAIFAPDPFGAYMSATSIFTFFEVFLFILTLCLAFDLRDIHLDKLSQVKTLVTKLGTQKATLLCLFLFFAQSALAFSLRPTPFTFLGELASLFFFSFLLKKV